MNKFILAVIFIVVSFGVFWNASAETVCQQVNKTFPPKTWNQCAFNIGERFMKVGALPSAISWCEKLFVRQSAVSDCVQGAFDGVGQRLFGNGDPLAVCKDQPKHYRINCYSSLVSALYQYSSQDFTKAIAYVNQIPEEYVRVKITGTLASTVAFRPVDPSVMVNACTELVGYQRTSCISGYAGGILEAAKPPEEFRKASGFCLSIEFSHEEQGKCVERVFSDYEFLYPGRASQTCRSIVPAGLMPFCPRQ